jgi:hypothetical protein
MADSHTVRVSAQYSSEGELWKAELLADGNVIATADRLANSAEARKAGEFLEFGAREHWQVLASPSERAIAASVPAVEAAIDEERTYDPSYDGFMQPGRLLRLIFGAIRREQAYEFLHPDVDRGPRHVYGITERWKLQTFEPYELAPRGSGGQRGVPHVTSPPNSRYLIVRLADAQMIARLIRDSLPNHPSELTPVVNRIFDETGADIEDIVARLKRLDVCAACVGESQERHCVCWGANRLGRRLSRLVDRANAHLADESDEDDE